MSRRAPRSEAPPARLWSLTYEQARWLRDAVAAGPEGAYVPITGRSAAAHELVTGGAAEYREVPRVGVGTRGVHDDRPCTWTDYYLVPTAHGLALLGTSVA